MTSNEVTVNVSSPVELVAHPSAEPSTICAGETVKLTANADGGTGSYTYLWTPGGSTESTFNDIPLVQQIILCL